MSTPRPLNLVHRGATHDFYLRCALGDSEALYNIVPSGSPAPGGGYKNMRYIEKVKGVRFPDRYQPTLHGAQSLYPHDNEPSRN